MEKIRAFCPDGIDLVIEMTGHVNFNNDLSILKKKGRLVLIGSKGTVQINPSIILVKEISISGVFLFESDEV
jgi:NADPH2:quinone reductase